MTAMVRAPRSLATLAACLALAAPAVAQTIPYGNPDTGGGGGDAAPASAGTSARPDAPAEEARAPRARVNRLEVSPYIEAAQVVTAELSPGNDVVTYSVLAAGVDLAMRGRNNEAAVSLRYERRIGYGKARDGDTISGLARAATTVVPGALRLEAGALAARSRVEGSGAAIISPLTQGDAVTQTYAVYAGPSLATRVGDVQVTGNYRIGYTKVESPDAILTAAGAPPVDVFDDSVTHSATLRAAMRPGEGLPVGLAVSGGFYQEDISNLDQRVRSLHARTDVTIPISLDVALVGGIGLEDVEVSSRDAVRTPDGTPLIGRDGRYVTDKSAPRVLSYDVEGLIWDAGVIWRPSRRTAFEAHVGRRYGSTSYYGSLAYAPNDRSALNVSVYDNISGFGGQVNRALAELPTDFEVIRNPLTGDTTGCVSSLENGGCLSGVLGSVRSSTFRARGVAASYARRMGRSLAAGISGGYDRRRYIAAPGTVLAVANGVVDENWWLAGYVTGRIDARSGFTVNGYVNWFESGFALAGDGRAMGATASYNRNLTNKLSATMALGIDGISRELLDDIWTASALVGVRYSF